MLTYRTPGVYFEWLDQRPPGLQARRTDITGMVGIAERGPLYVPLRVESWSQFTTTFGPHIAPGYLAYAVEGFLTNGGQTCWVVRVADADRARPASLDLVDEYGWPIVRLSASSPGTWGQRIAITVAQSGQDRFSLTVRLLDGGQEIWRNLGLDLDDMERTLNDAQTGSRLVRASRPPSDPWTGIPSLQPFEQRVARADLEGGQDGLSGLRVEHFKQGLEALEGIDEVSIVAMPDIMPKPVAVYEHRRPKPRCHVLDAEPVPAAATQRSAEQVEYPPQFSDVEIHELQLALIAHCEKLKDRVAILDPWREDKTPQQAIGRRYQFNTKYAALYYPWLLVPNPAGYRDVTPGSDLLRAVPPSGHVAGVYARGDLAIGVHKPPANEALEAVKDLAAFVDDTDHGELNAHGVNAIRAYSGRGLRVYGARTLSSEPEWRYVNVRRLLIMIKEAIDEQLQWTVFEPHNPVLWGDIERVVRSFLDRLWQRGWLDGATAEQAYRVRCDQATNPPEETSQGRIICEIGLQPPWPAEFVVVRIGRTESGTEVIEESRE